MRDKRQSEQVWSPHYEDAGLFKHALTTCELLLTPLFQTTSRGDIVFEADWLREDKPMRQIDVVFAGRRSDAARSLVERMKRMIAQAKRDAARLEMKPDFNSLRLPTCIQGSWRARLTEDADGWRSRDYQLIAAQWAIPDHSGQPQFRGEPPAIAPKVE